MTEQPPVLDTRGPSDIMARLQELARESLPAWLPPADGDAGTMLQQGFTRLLELALLRLNQVPEKNFLAFLDVMGVSLLPPAPARVPLTFTLAPGSAPTEVPDGTVASARASAGQPTVTFETETPLTVVPSQLVAATTVDPVGDRYSDQTAAIAGNAGGFAPFTGTLRIPHALWLGTGTLLQAGGTANVQVVLRYSSRRPAAEVTRFFAAMTFEYQSGGVLTTAIPLQVSQGSGTVTMNFAVGPVDLQTVDAPGLSAPMPGRWLRTRLATALPLDPVAQDLSIAGGSVSINGTGLSPDAALAGTTPVDTSKDFRPFGDTPRVGDAFYLGSDEAFGNIGALVQIAFAAGAGTATNVQLAWEYLGDGGWTSLPVQVTPGFNLTQDGTVTIGSLPALAKAAVGGTASHWIRVRIAGGGYGSPLQWVPAGSTVAPQAGTGNLDPPRVRSVSVTYSATTAPVILRQSGAVFSDQTATVAAGQPFPAYLPATAITPPALADAEPTFYLGFDTVPPGYPVTVYVAAAPRVFPGRVIRQPVSGSVPAPASQPGPAAWEYFDGTAWQPLPVLDGTQDLTISGPLTMIIPADMAPLARFDSAARYWIRAQSARTGPADQRLLAGVFANTVSAVQAGTVASEVIGSGNGQPGQECQLAQPPVLPGQQVWVQEAEPPPAAELQVLQAQEGADAVTSRPDPATGAPQTWVRWHEVASFVCSGPADRHYTLDHTSGVVTFGDGASGLIPPTGARNLTASYRTGGGPAGNVPAGSVGQILTPIPAVTTVTNPIDADGGAVAETVPQVLTRGPQAVRSRDRAVAGDDYEWLARHAAGTGVARAVCLPNVNSELRFEPGWVTVVVIPQGGDRKPTPRVELVAAIEEYLQARASVGLVQQLPGRISVIGPGYLRVAVAAQVVPHDISQVVEVKQQVESALASFLHPLTGGRAGTGWELGRDVYISEVARVIEQAPGVSYVKSLRLLPSAVQRRLALPAVPAPVLAADAPVGSVVTTTDRRKAALLSEPAAAAALADHLTIRCLQEGDLVSCVLDLLVTAAVAPGVTTLTAIPAPWGGPGGFPCGTAVLTADGRQTQLTGAIGPIAAGGSPGAISMQVQDPAFTAGLSAGSRITLVGPLALAIVSVAQPAATSPGQQPVLDVRVEPTRTDLTFPAGAVLGTADGRIRLPLAAAAVPDPATATITAVALQDFRAGDPVILLAGDGTLQALTSTVAQVTPVDELVYLDPNVFPYVTDHQIQMIGQ